MCNECIQELGVASRMQIYALLKQAGELPVKTLTQKLKLKQPTVTYHLHQLEKVGLVSHIKQGRQTIYSINRICKHTGNVCILSQAHIYA